MYEISDIALERKKFVNENIFVLFCVFKNLWMHSLFAQ